MPPLSKHRQSIGCLGAVLFLVCLPGPLRAHICENTTIVLDTLSPGVVEEEICYYDLGLCLADTFYQDLLLEELVNQWTLKQHVVLGQVTSVDTFGLLETFPINDSLFVTVPFHQEDLSINILKNLKDSVPRERLDLSEKWAVAELDTITYLPAQDTTFIAFFNRYDSLKHMGLRPTVDCLFEPTVYFIIEGRIFKRGIGRMPGVSVGLQEYFLVISQIASTGRLRPKPGRPSQGEWYNILGQKLEPSFSGNETRFRGTIELRR